MVQSDNADEPQPHLDCTGAFPSCRVYTFSWRRLGVDVKVILTPPCVFCMANH